MNFQPEKIPRPLEGSEKTELSARMVSFLQLEVGRTRIMAPLTYEEGIVFYNRLQEEFDCPLWDVPTRTGIEAVCSAIDKFLTAIDRVKPSSLSNPDAKMKNAITIVRDNEEWVVSADAIASLRANGERETIVNVWVLDKARNRAMSDDIHVPLGIEFIKKSIEHTKAANSSSPKK